VTAARRRLALLVPAIALSALLVILAVRRSPPADPSPAGERRLADPAVPGAPPPAATRPAAPAPEELRAKATALRRRCRREKEAVGDLLRILGDPGASAADREVAALVLGSLADPEAKRALLAALREAKDPDWIVALVLALGMADQLRRDDVFGLPEGEPGVVETPHGLSVYVERLIEEAEVRDALVGRLGHEDARVRQAALRSLRHSAVEEAAGRPELAAAREALTGMMEGDSDPTLRAEAGGAVADWLLRAPSERTDRAGVLDRLMGKSVQDAEAELRFRAANTLGSVVLPETALNRVLESSLPGASFEKRAWALELAGRHAAALGEERRRVILDAALADGDAKVRETAVHQLGRFPKSAETLGFAVGALGDPAWNVRYAAARSLGSHPADPAARERLERLAQSDPEGAVRDAARKTLEGWASR
jgi:HEAT repeat protein